ncbi:CHAT domain-containing protein [Streptomyces acidicola]|uniref:CHAT domain-containing protein n=1 Tax=Streptomyces acidicola TaxID=2596892 RepID=A0A5N8WUU3_9ACTN|nr:CHAT domain-containing protein [Streptomyces acidicola]MPY51171.1 CHAT domain-containing protein [Streptomyces acidicola]
MQGREQDFAREHELEQRIAVVGLRLERLAREQDLGVVLEPEALVEARQLAAILRNDESDLEGHYVLGWLHAFRYRALPEGAGQRDREEAVAKFTPCFVFGADEEDLPDELLPDVAQHALGFVWRIQQGMDASPSPALRARMTDLLRRIAAAIPRGQSEHAETLSNLSVILKSHFDVGGERADLDAAIDAAQGAVESTATGHPNQPVMLSNLSGVLMERFTHTGMAADLDDAIETGRLAVQAAAGSPAHRAGGLNNLGTALQTRFTERGILSDLDAAIEAFQEASDLCAEDDDKAGFLHNLGIAWRARYESTGVPADLDSAIECGQTAVEDASEEHPGRSIFLFGLGDITLTRFERTGETAYLDRSVNAFQEALEMLPPGHRARGLRLSGLGQALLARYRNGGDRYDLDTAIEMNRAASREITPNQTEFNAALNNLAISLWQRFECTGDMADLDEAISVSRASAQATADGHVDRSTRLSNVGLMLWTRFKHTGGMSDLDAAIEFAHGAVKTAPREHSAFAAMLSNLGAVLLQRYERNGDPQDLDEVIRRNREVLGIVDASSPDRPRFLANLSVALYARFQRAGSFEDLDGAVAAGQDATATVPSHHPERSRYLSLLGGVLTVRFEKTGSTADLDDAVVACQAALDTSPAEHPERADYLFQLGSALHRRYQRTHLRQDFDRALAAHMEGARADGARPSIRIRAAQAAASMTGRSDPDLAADLLDGAVRLLPEVADRRLSRGDQQHAMGKWSGLAGDAAALALASREGTPAERAARALQLIEVGRGVLHSQALDMRSDLAELRERHPDLAHRFEVLRDELDRPMELASLTEPDGQVSAAVRAVDAEEQRRSRADQLQATLGNIRAQEGFASFARPPAVSELLAQAASGPVVSFTVSHYRSDALLLTSDGIESLNLPDLTYDLVIDQIQTFHGALETVADPRMSPLTRKEAQATLHAVLGWLWDAAAEPVLRSLGFTGEPSPGQPWPRVWWAPGGLLSLLPLHAAGHHSEPLRADLRDGEPPTVMDRVISSYTTTIRALHHARRRRTSAPSVSRSLIVAMPTTPGVQGRLDHVSEEAALLCGLLPEPTLLMAPGAEADGMTVPGPETRPTKARVLKALSDSGIVHFACHGAHDPDDPSQSLLLLHDHERDPLTVASLAGMKMDSAQLAYLSACRTAFMESVELIDEAIHLTSAFQLAGFPHVIGTLWEINDEVASHMAADFYAELGGVTDQHADLDTDAAARALHHTVRRVRDRYSKSPYLWAAHLHAGI